MDPLGDNRTVFSYSFYVDPGDAESVSVTVTAGLAGSSDTASKSFGPYSGAWGTDYETLTVGYATVIDGDTSTQRPASFTGRLTFVVTYEQDGASRSQTYVEEFPYATT